MNYPYPIPSSQQGSSRPTYVADITGKLGTFTMSVDTYVGITVDYTQLSPTMNIVGFWFKVKPGGMPSLVISGATTVAGSDIVTFTLRGGMPGRNYKLTINAQGQLGGWRSDVLNVNVQGDDCNYSRVLPPPPNMGVTSGDGKIVVNTAPRFFISATPPVTAQALDRWYNSSSGDVYDFISDGVTGYWTLAIVAGGGATPPPVTSGGASIVKINPIVPDGVTTTFTLTATGGASVNIIGVDSLFVSVDGEWQEPLAQYIADSNQIIFTEAPTADAHIFMIWFSAPPANDSGANGANIVKLSPIIPDGITTTFLLTSSTGLVNILGSNSLFVSVDGVWQEPTAQYAAAASLITFVQAPTTDASIFILWFAPPGS